MLSFESAAVVRSCPQSESHSWAKFLTGGNKDLKSDGANGCNILKTHLFGEKNKSWDM